MSDEVVDLLQHLIRNVCVNDGTETSGHEVRSADVLESYLEGSGVDIERYDAAPGRTSLVARIEGSDPAAPTLLLMGHTDVVPANPDGWQRDPFGGELVDGEVWGRGAVDMLNLTASMAVATKNLARSGFRPRGTLVYLAVADEEALGSLGAGHLVEHEADAVRADYVITESGGIPLPSPTGVKLPVIVAEKGSNWIELRVRGTPGHGSQPYKTDNALVTAAQVVQRIAEFAPATEIHDIWRDFLVGMEWGDDLVGPLLDPATFDDACDALPIGMGRMFHACTHTTFAPTIARGGTKVNVIPDRVDLQVDIRTLPGHGVPEQQAMLDEALGDLADRVEVVASHEDPSTASPVDTPLWDSLGRVAQRFYEGSSLVPLMTVGATDAALLPPARHDVLRVRPVLDAPLLRRLRADVPRRRRAGGRRVAPPLDRDVGSARARPPRRVMAIRAAFFDLGGVLLSSPFEAFSRYEEAHGLPRDLLRTVNATDPDTNAWARFERSEVTFEEFCDLFEAECRAQGHDVVARDVMPLLLGELRPPMVEAVRRCHERLVTACLTNNWVAHGERPPEREVNGREDVFALFHHVIESSVVGVRKPDPRFYELACEISGVEPDEAVFLDDLGVNLKPARAMGMTTIKVDDPDQAITDLEEVVGFPLR